MFACLLSLVSGEAGAQDIPPIERTEDAVVGASVFHPAKWYVQRERHTYDETYGFTLWRPEAPSSHDHGGTPAARVALAYDLKPGQIEGRVRERLAEYPDPPLKREEISVAEKRHKGIAVGPIPGSTPSVEIYVPVNGRVYQINVYSQKPGQEGLGVADRELLRGLRFEPPSRPVASLGLPGANAPEALHAVGDPELTAAEEHKAVTEEASFGASFLSASGVPTYEERRMKDDCWRAKSPFFFQTQHGANANKGWYPKGSDKHTGWSKLGMPNYWNQYSHGRLGYGRCKERYYTNDKYAIDYPLKRGDVIFSPFKRGKVTFAGRNYTHRDYGIFVTIKADNGKYVSMSAHLSGLARGIKKGVRVTDNTVIGYAGDSGGSRIAVGYPHLHQAFYRQPHYNPDGSPYGGAGLKVIHHRYASADGPGVYTYGWKRTQRFKAEGSWVSN